MKGATYRGAGFNPETPFPQYFYTGKHILKQHPAGRSRNRNFVARLKIGWNTQSDKNHIFDDLAAHFFV
ncbi:MAG: hypothetical protein LRY55_07100 [Leadbetterella sp.]|nr:hypothetical protein [Leadbetterella sp.]